MCVFVGGGGETRTIIKNLKKDKEERKDKLYCIFSEQREESSLFVKRVSQKERNVFSEQF